SDLEQQRADARDVGLEGQYLQIPHQLDVFVDRLRRAERQLHFRHHTRALRSQLHSTFHFAHGGEVGIETQLVVVAKTLFQFAGFVRYCIENTGVRYATSLPFLWSRAVTKEALEDQQGIHFVRQWLRRAGPGHRVRIRAPVTPATHTGVANWVFDTKLNRREQGALAITLSDVLINA